MEIIVQIVRNCFQPQKPYLDIKENNILNFEARLVNIHISICELCFIEFKNFIKLDPFS